MPTGLEPDVMTMTSFLDLRELKFAIGWGVVWGSIAVAWSWGCIWIGNDARRLFGRGMPWRVASTLTGAAMLIGLFWLGRSAAFSLTLFPCLLLVYITYREQKVRPEDRLAVRRFVESNLLAVNDWVRQQTGNTPVNGLVGPKSVVLQKKDGRPYEALDKVASQVVTEVARQLGEAIEQGATDVHFETRSGGDVHVRFRIDGMMQPPRILKGTMGRQATSVLKVLADMDIAERRRTQDGSFTMVADGRKFDVRSSSAPTDFGETIVLRLLDPDDIKRLEDLGMPSSIREQVISFTTRAHGMLLVCGPTGSGKTTTLFAALQQIDAFTRNVTTIEDPIEYRLANATQQAVDIAKGMTFAARLRSVLRQDPDVILVGEIRDRETAETAMNAALTGHLVFSTIHANDTASTITRLVELGIDATLIQSALTAVLAQRLVRVLCRKCRESYEPPESIRRRFGLPPGKVPLLYKAVGCGVCRNTGYRGRTGVYELMLIDESLRRLLVGRPSIDALRTAAEKLGMRSLQYAALRLAVSGKTSIDEVLRLAR